MDSSLRDCCSLGVVQFMLFPEAMKGGTASVEALETVAREPALAAVEVTGFGTDSLRGRAAAIIRDSGMVAAFGAQPALLSRKLSLCDLDPKKREEAARVVRGCIEEAAELNCVGVAVLSGTDPGEGRRAEARAALYDSLVELASSAAAKGLALELESFDRVGFGKNCLIGPTREAVELAKKVREECPDFGLLLDLSHMPLLEESPREMLLPAREVLTHVHVGNCVMKYPSHPAYGDSHPPFGIPEGEVGVKELSDFLKVLIEAGCMEKGGSMIVSAEVKPLKGQDPEVILAATLRRIERAWAMV